MRLNSFYLLEFSIMPLFSSVDICKDSKLVILNKNVRSKVNKLCWAVMVIWGRHATTFVAVDVLRVEMLQVNSGLSLNLYFQSRYANPGLALVQG